MEQYKSTFTRKEIENELTIVRNGRIFDGSISGDLNIGGELTVIVKFSRKIYSISSPCLKLIPESDTFKTYVFLLDSFENDTATLYHNNTLIKCTSERISDEIENNVNEGYVIIGYKLIVTDIIDLSDVKYLPEIINFTEETRIMPHFGYFNGFLDEENPRTKLYYYIDKLSEPALKTSSKILYNQNTYEYATILYVNNTTSEIQFFIDNKILHCNFNLGVLDENFSEYFNCFEIEIFLKNIIDLTKLSKPEYELIVTENALSNRSDLNTLIKSIINGDDFPIVYINYNNYKIQTSLAYDKTNTALSITALNSKTLIHVSYQYYPNQSKVYGGGIEIYNSITDSSPKLIPLSPTTA